MLQFMVDVEGFFVGEGLCSRLLNHTQNAMDRMGHDIGEFLFAYPVTDSNRSPNISWLGAHEVFLFNHNVSENSHAVCPSKMKRKHLVDERQRSH